MLRRRNKKSSKLLNIIILILMIILGVILYKIWNFWNIGVLNIGGHNYINTPSKQKKIQSQIDKDQVIKEKLTKAFKKVDKHIVLEGTVTTDREYTTDDRDLNDSEKRGGMKWFVNKLKDLKVKEITVHTIYYCGYVFDFGLIEPKVKNGIVNIVLSEGQLYINPLAELTSKTLLDDHTRLMSGVFTPQQTTAYMNRTLMYVMNNIESDDELKKDALDSAVENIINTGAKYGVSRDNIFVEVIEHESMPNTQAQIVEKDVVKQNIVWNTLTDTIADNESNTMDWKMKYSN